MSDPNLEPAVFAARAGYDIYVLRYLSPRPPLERERSRDRSCINLSAALRNRKKMEEARVAWVNHDTRSIYCAPWVYKELRAALEKDRGAS